MEVFLAKLVIDSKSQEIFLNDIKADISWLSQKVKVRYDYD